MAHLIPDILMFEHSYRCYPVSFIDKPHLENGDKIIMPPSALDHLASLHIEYPMLFELRNSSASKVTHCGVLEFVAEEGLIFLPYWMMENMLLQEGDVVQLKNVSLQKGSYVKLQPHTSDFLDITNPKAILETSLRNYSCLTAGDTIMVAYNNNKYYIDIVETKPSPAISIIETDCEVDFAPPLDYKEPEKPQPNLRPNKRPLEVEEEEDVAQKIPKFNPFTGVARRLDGKLSTEQPTSGTDPAVKQQQKEAGKDVCSSKASTSASHSRSGKLVFGSNGNQSRKGMPKVVVPVKSSEEAAQKVEDAKFEAFTGKKYSLKS